MVGIVADGKAPVDNVLQVSGHFISNREYHFGGEDRSVRIDGLVQWRFCGSEREQVQRAATIKGNLPLDTGGRQFLESLQGMSCVVQAVGAWEQDVLRAALRQLPMQEPANSIDRLLGQISISRQLSADDRNKTVCILAVNLDDVLACYR